ncbi:MAG: putative Ig domain [Frankiaceae bacterium]|nr:putative Ig domain [Frankiaceae bacterium]
MLRMMSLAVMAVATALAALLLVPANAFAVTVDRAQLIGGQLRLDGKNAAPGQFVMVESASSAAGARSDSSGAYRVQATNFRSDDCKVVVRDGKTPIATVGLAGCTPTPATPSSPPPPPTGSCVITPQAPATRALGVATAFDLATTGCDNTTGPVQWALLSGHIPTGMVGPYFQGQTGGHLIGTPTVRGTYSFMLQVTDSLGATDAETFTITVT